MASRGMIPIFSREKDNAASSLSALGETKPLEAFLSNHVIIEHNDKKIPHKSTNHTKAESVRSDQFFSDDDDQPSSQTVQREMAFPETLMKLLTDPVYENMLTFLSDDNTFVILRPKMFSRLLLPRHFLMRKFPAFINKLNLWGFKQINGGPNQGCPTFFHPLFRKNEWGLCREIKLKSRRKARRTKQAQHKSSNLNFYSDLFENEIPQESTEEKDKEQKMITVNRQLCLQAQLRALQQEEGRLTAKKRERLSLQTSELSSENDVIEITKEIVGAAIDCLLVDEDHTRSLMARYSLPLNQASDNILSQLRLTQDQFPNITSFRHSIDDRIQHQLDASNDLFKLNEIRRTKGFIGLI